MPVLDLALGHRYPFTGRLFRLPRESQQAVPPAAQAPSPASSPVPPLPVQTKGREIRSDRERNDSPRASTRDLKALAQGNNAFALDLYRKLSNGEGNLFFSPFSVSQVLAMAFAGARGETERQMANTLHYDLPQSALHPSFNALDRELASRGRGLQGEENQFFQLNIANAIWGQQGYEFLPDFLDALAENYGAGLRPLDFTGAPEESRVKINDWVSEETEGKVRDLLPPGTVDSLTAWFSPTPYTSMPLGRGPSTRDSLRNVPFTGGRRRDPDADDVGNFRHFYGYFDGRQDIRRSTCSLFSGEMSMTILLPDAGKFREFEDSLSAEVLSRILDVIEIDHVALTMPLFQFESQFNLGETLAGMGMPDAFGGSADFSGMTGTKGLQISEVVHKAFVSVDEGARRRRRPRVW